MAAQSAKASPAPTWAGATMPAITQAPMSASASASQTRPGGCSAKMSAPPITVRIGATLPMKVALATLRAEDREIERADVDREGEPGQHERNRGGPEVLRLRIGPAGGPDPDGQRRDGEPHAPGRSGQRPDVEKADQDARPGDDRGPREKRDQPDAIEGRRRGRRGFRLCRSSRVRYPIPTRFRASAPAYAKGFGESPSPAFGEMVWMKGGARSCTRSNAPRPLAPAPHPGARDHPKAVKGALFSERSSVFEQALRRCRLKPREASCSSISTGR